MRTLIVYAALFGGFFVVKAYKDTEHAREQKRIEEQRRVAEEERSRKEKEAMQNLFKQPNRFSYGNERWLEKWRREQKAKSRPWWEVPLNSEKEKKSLDFSALSIDTSTMPPPDPKPEWNIIVKNACHEDIELAVHYESAKAGQWFTVAWWSVKAGEQKALRIVPQGAKSGEPLVTSNKVFYFYAKSASYTWRQGQGNEGKSMRVGSETLDMAQKSGHVVDNSLHLRLTCK